jgi:hypothetical protein
MGHAYNSPARPTVWAVFQRQPAIGRLIQIPTTTRESTLSLLVRLQASFFNGRKFAKLRGYMKMLILCRVLVVSVVEHGKVSRFCGHVLHFMLTTSGVPA